jgi:hypothetical protein
MKKIKIRNVRRDDLKHLLELNQSNLPHVGSLQIKQVVLLRSSSPNGVVE